MLYRFADLIVESDIPLPELPTAESGSPECRVRVGPCLRSDPVTFRWDHHWRSAEGAVALSCARDGDRYRLGVPGIALFAIEDDGSAILVRPVAGAPGGTLEHVLIDQVLPRVLAQRGRLTLHAGCVGTPFGAIGFLGDSGRGKSTLCAAFSRGGHLLLGDDGVVVTEGAGGFAARATYPGLRLLPDPFSVLFDATTETEPVAHYTAKRRVGRRAAGLTLAEGSEPLCALYWLSEGPRIEIAALSGRDAFLALVRSAFALHLGDRHRSQALFDRLGALRDGVPVRRLSYPREFGVLDDVRQALIRDVASYRECASAS